MTIGKNSRPQNSGIGNLAQGSAKLPLSGAPNGNPVLVLNSSTGDVYNAIHTFSLGVIEELYLWCSNSTAGAVELTMSFADAAFGGNDNIIVSISGKTGMNLVYPGVPHIGNTASTQTLYLRAASANALTVSGFVIRSYPFSGKNASSYGYFNSESGD
jgi:hypothetical protein